MTIEPRQLLLLLNWMSPAFPTGGFAYSHGLEWAIENGIVRKSGDLTEWISDLLIRGSGWNDAVLFSRCWSEDQGELNELALALASSKERYVETAQLGKAFAIASHVFASQHDERRASFLSPLSRGEDEVAYPVAVGLACFAEGIEKWPALLAFLQGFTNALVSVAVRLVPLGQTQGLETIRDLMPVIAATAQRAEAASLADLGSITLASDIAAMNHETQPSRIFRS